MIQQNAYKVKNAHNPIQVSGVTLFGGYAGLPIYSLIFVEVDA